MVVLNFHYLVLNNMAVNKKLTEAILKEYTKRTNSLWYQLYPDEGDYARDKYPIVVKFFKDGKDKAQRFLWSANRTGKSIGGTYEVSLHIKQEYPIWWEGVTYDGPMTIWIVAHKFDNLRDPIQKYLLGDLTPGFQKEGLLPHKGLVGKPVKKIGTDGVYSSFKYKAKNGHVVEVVFKAMTEGWEAFRGGNPTIILLDDVDDSMVFSECTARLTSTTGINEQVVANRRLIVTSTPEHGYTDMVVSASKAKESGHGEIYTISLYDVPHVSKEEAKKREDECPPHLVRAKIYGEPSMGSGQVIPVDPALFTVDPFPIPDHWLLHGSIDTGTKETAVSFMALDPDNDVLYRIGEAKFNDKNAVEIGACLQVRVKIPYVIDNQSKVVSQTDKQSVWMIMQRMGIEVYTPEKHAKETSINMLWDRINSGRFKNFSTCGEFIKEYRMWQRDLDGKVKDTKDHFIDTVLYSVRSGVNYGRTKFQCYHPDEDEFAAKYGLKVPDGGSSSGGNVLGGY